MATKHNETEELVWGEWAKEADGEAIRVAFTAQPDDLKAILEFVPGDGIRPYLEVLAGVLTTDNRIVLAATDTYLVACLSIAANKPSVDRDFAFVIPPDAIRRVLGAQPKEHGEWWPSGAVWVQVRQNFVTLRRGGLRADVPQRAVMGGTRAQRFPDWSQLSSAHGQPGNGVLSIRRESLLRLARASKHLGSRMVIFQDCAPGKVCRVQFTDRANLFVYAMTGNMKDLPTLPAWIADSGRRFTQATHSE